MGESISAAGAGAVPSTATAIDPARNHLPPLDGLRALAIIFVTLTHADGILTGSAIALYGDAVYAYRRYAGPVMVLMAAVLAGIFLTAGTTHYQDPVVQRFAFLPIALFCSAFLILALDSPVLARFLSAQPLRLVGQYSFFIYLTHGPLLIVLDQLPLPDGILAWAIYAVSFTAGITALGHLSWTLFEYPAAQAIRRHLLPRQGQIAQSAVPVSAGHD